MKIEHIAMWVSNLEVSRQFYTKYFQMTSNDKYENKSKLFTSYFLSNNEGARLEIMHKPELETNTINNNQLGLVHLTFSCGSRDAVDLLTEQLRHDGYTIQGEPRLTGDGYYESVILDPDGNWIEITE
ncbi:VOC family protein [Carboxylicivirga marina]|uniref:VOC family protein n=1 Tax=Carboxylicivirga marina TaxID=2800988 RepID=A0ABS1HKM0_9BACT|nr:VOC family protein [Carboxylicivirga marina]MBK3518146.1 VOC family protein [Carboxylicivirga marina]